MTAVRREAGSSWRNGLTSEQCSAMLRDDTHIFRRMWSADGWSRMAADRPPCWEVRRDEPRAQYADDFFRETLEGAHCSSNWYEGTHSWIGDPGQTPGSGPAVLGFDEAIESYCNKHGGGQGNHAEKCLSAHFNILSLHGDRVPYNICRNLEWQVCAAQGLLPGQNGRHIIFAYEPRALDPEGGNGKPLGHCGGWTPGQVAGGVFGYATEDIFYLEVCLFSQMCSNGADLFSLKAGSVFVCEFSADKFNELAQILQTPAAHPTHGEDHCTGHATHFRSVEGWPLPPRADPEHQQGSEDQQGSEGGVPQQGTNSDWNPGADMARGGNCAGWCDPDHCQHHWACKDCSYCHRR